MRDIAMAVAEMQEVLRSFDGVVLHAIGHRVVHGGPDFAYPVLIDEAVLRRLKTFQDLAPLHQPSNLAPIRLPMGTRAGQLDPGVVLYLMDQMGMTPREVSDLLYRESGLKGLSGVSSDMRELLASSAPESAFAVDYFAYRCGLHAGQLAAALEGVDAVVFTAGIGENSPEIRARIAARLSWLGASLDPGANSTGATCISNPESRVALHVIPTDEELMIARHTRALVGTFMI